MTGLWIHLKGFAQYQNLLWELVIRDIKVRYRRSLLGVFWTLLNPLLTMMVLTVVFSLLFKETIKNFPVYLLSGQVIFTYYSEVTSNALYAVIGNGSLFKKVYMPKYLFPMSRAVSTLVNLGASLVALVVVMAFTSAPFYPTILLSPLVFLYLFGFTCGMSLILSALAVFYRDIVHLYSVLLVAWMYLTPVFYPSDILPSRVRDFLILNPMANYVGMFRALVYEGRWPLGTEHLSCLLPAVLALGVGICYFYQAQKRFILYV